MAGSYDSESEMCEAFAEVARAEGWTVYPECQGWDMVLQGPGCAYTEEDQIGIEAKLRANLKVLHQALRNIRYGKSGPDWAGVVVPEVSRSLEVVSRKLGLEAWGVSEMRERGMPHIRPADSRLLDFEEPVWTPPVVPDVRPGQPSPSPLTPWRVKALKLCAVLRVRGWVGMDDFERADVDRTTFRRHGWIRRDSSLEEEDDDAGGRARYVPGWVDRPYVEDNFDDFPDVGWESEQLEIMESNPEGVPDEIAETFVERHPGDLEHPVATAGDGEKELARAILESDG